MIEEKSEQSTHEPERTCVACGAKKPQRELLRVASQGGSTPTIDGSGKAKGRGAYLCLDAACVERAIKRKAFERTLKLKTGVPPQIKAMPKHANPISPSASR